MISSTEVKFWFKVIYHTVDPIKQKWIATSINYVARDAVEI
jgi:hypothetical protein